MGRSAEAFGRYQAHRDQTHASAVDNAFEPLWNLDAVSAETIDSLR